MDQNLGLIWERCLKFMRDNLSASEHEDVKKVPGVKIEFEYEIYNDSKQKITEASTTLFFLDATTNKVSRCPDFLMKLIQKNWKE